MKQTLIHAALTALLAVASTTALAAPSTKVAQGGVARWAGLDAKSCGFLGKRYAAIKGDCYYPADFRLKPGEHQIALYDSQGKQHLATLQVEAVEFPEIAIELKDPRYIELSAEDQQRHLKERRKVLALFKPTERTPEFSLPLRRPVENLPQSENDFGSVRIFNGTRKSQHTGRDAPISAGTALHALADGKVLLAEDQFFTGNAVYVDHGGGLISMFFHLSKLEVAEGDQVKAGQVLGRVGSTGRSTGAHMHVGVRWLGARIDPYLLFEPTSTLPAVADSLARADSKIDAARHAEPVESNPQPNKE